MRAAALALLALLLGASSCQTPITACPPIVAYSAEFNSALAAEVEQMPEDSAALRAIQDYIAERDQLKKCQ